LSETKRSAANQWFTNTLLSRLDDKRTGTIVVVMQRVHIDDLIGNRNSNLRYYRGTVRLALGDVFRRQDLHNILPRIADRPGRRNLKDSGPVPVAFRAQDDVSPAVERDCIGKRLYVERHFGIPEPGKGEVPVRTDRLAAKACPESFEAFARMSIDSPEAFAPRQIDAGAGKLESERRLPEFFQYS
jgi:hypothetical protein